MNKFIGVSVVLLSALLSACSAPPIKGDSAQNRKSVSFPKVGIQAGQSHQNANAIVVDPLK